jgi:hypothetical protein
MTNATRASTVRGIPEIRNGHRSGPGILVVVLAEFRRGVAAAQRYETLRYCSACDGRLAPADIPRRIFEEFYSSSGGAVNQRPRAVVSQFEFRLTTPLRTSFRR